MPTKATIKLIKQLQQKKYRKKHQWFVVEGLKSIQEFLKSDFTLVHFYATEAYSKDFPSAEIITAQEMKQMSALNTPPNMLAVFEQAQVEIPQQIEHICFALDDVQDPGNLGTIIRLADWFGMNHIFCSENTVDLYNPKVVQASMGSLSRVQVHYTDLKEIIQTLQVPVLGTFMKGQNIYTTEFPSQGLLVMGNEAHGISEEIQKLCTQKISIPQQGQSTESLNVAIASAIIAGQIFAKRMI